MPRRSYLKTLLIESMLFVSLFAVVAHLSINFWERYVIQSELSHMKYSLHAMKETVNKIGHAYDILEKDLKEVIKEAEKKIGTNRQNTLDRRTLHNMKVQALVKAKNQGVDVTQRIQNGVTNDNRPISNNATTNTRYPTKSTGIGSYPENAEVKCCNRETCGRRKPKCYEVYNYCKDPRVVFGF